MADELAGAGASCDRLDPAPDCSAVRRAIRDYAIVRDQIRAIEGGPGS